MPRLLFASTCALIAVCDARAPSDPWTTRTDSASTVASIGRPAQGAPEKAVDLTRERTLIDESEAARKDSDYATARTKAAEAVASLLARPETDQDSEWLALLNSAGHSARAAQDPRTANTAWKRVFDIRSRTLPDEHADLQSARESLAVTMMNLGDRDGARDLFKKVLEVRSRTLPDDDPDLQMARGNLAWAISALGDLEGARDYQAKVLEVFSRTLPDEHPDLQLARWHLAVTLGDLGDLAAERALEEKVLEVYSRTLPDEHPQLQTARTSFAVTIRALGDLAGARALFEKVLEVRSRTLPDDHLHLQEARLNVAVATADFGDLAGARILFERVLEVLDRTLPDDHPQLQAVRNNLAVTIYLLGDLAGARTLQEKVLDVLARTLPDDHPQLQAARTGLAMTIRAQGDLNGARALQEKVLEIDSSTLPEDHPNVLMARGNLAGTLRDLRDFTGARTLEEIVLEVSSRTLLDDHPQLQMARLNLAVTRMNLGELAGARTLFEKVLEVYARTLPDEHPDLQLARQGLAWTIANQLARAGPGSEGEAEGEGWRERKANRERSADLIAALCRAQARAAREAILRSPGREAEERASELARDLDVSLSFASGLGAFEPLRMLESESFVLAETTRGAAIVSAELTRRAAKSPGYATLREALREASDELAALAQRGTTGEGFDRARTKRESAERELVALARDLSGGEQSGLEFDVDSLAARLEEREAAVGFRRFKKGRVDVVDELDSTGQPAVRASSVDSLCAFVVRSAKSGAGPEASPTPALALVDLGPIAPIEAAVRAWRDGLDVGSGGRGIGVDSQRESPSDLAAVGSALREKVFDPLLPALAGAQRLVVVLDDVLHLVPLDALPFDEVSLLGDRWRIETHATLLELLQTPEPLGESGQLVAFGDVAYGAEAASEDTGAAIQLAAADVRPRATDFEPRSAEDAGILRGSVWSEGFSALPGTGVEVRGIARCFRDRFGADAAPELCEHAGATRTRLLALASQARWLHIATHGWFAPESIKSWNDPNPLDEKSGLATRMSGEEQVKGMSPMLLCGLALAGANLPENAIGRVPGLVTADELSTLDLTGCELVVLSACDTNVGERRAGQGVASLQKALQMAGARSVITSLWKIPDVATQELMLDFYRRLWIEKKPKWQALWEAKMKIRNAKDEHGRPLYTTRDWAAWVLTGDPN